MPMIVAAVLTGLTLLGSGGAADAPCPELREEVVVRADFGTEPGQFGDTDWRTDDDHSRPSPFFEGEDGNLYVMDYVRAEVKQFSPDGSWVRNIPVSRGGRWLRDFVVTDGKLIWFVETDVVLLTDIASGEEQRLAVSSAIRQQLPFSLERSDKALPPNAYVNVGGQLHLYVDKGLVTLVNTNSGLVHPIFDATGPVSVARQTAEARFGRVCGDTRVCALQEEDRQRGLPKGSIIEVNPDGSLKRVVSSRHGMEDVRDGRLLNGRLDRNTVVFTIRDLNWTCYGTMRVPDRYAPGPSTPQRFWLSRSGESIWEIYMTREKQFVISRWTVREGGGR